MIACIWDLDGTLIDSYDAIMEALEVLYDYYGIDFDGKAIRTYILQESVGSLLEILAKKHDLDVIGLRSYFSHEQEKRDYMIKLLPEAKQVLEKLHAHGIQQFMYTHKGASTQQVLSNLGIGSYFTEVLTGVSGFKRKPHPEGIFYLMDTYQLDKQETYYIGDRRLDVEVAVNAGIKSINLTQENSAVNQKIAQLSDLLTLFHIN